MRRREMIQRPPRRCAPPACPSAAVESPWPPGRRAAAPGKPEPFDYAKLKGQARQLSTQAYKQRPDALPPAIAALNWDRWQSIRFRNEESLWADDHLRYQVRFFHLGFTSKKPVRVPGREWPGPGTGLRPQHVRLQQQRT